ncbi:hypothetical protein IAT38_006677 [Cryptococcus sp. DSM 104549]
MGKLKSALANQQYNAALHAAKKRAAAAEDAKKASIRASLDGSKKGKKRAKQALAARQAADPSGSEAARPKGKTREQRATVPFGVQDTVLLLGEANFSFARSLILEPHNLPGHQILATAFDNEEVTLKKYPDAQANVEALRAGGVKVEFGVDAGALEKCKAVGKGRRWSRVVFNFPHVGAGITDQDRNILTNQHMLLRFFRSVEPFLTDGPTHIPIPSAPKHTKKTKLPKSKNKPKHKSTSDDEAGGADGVSDMEEDDGFIENDDDPDLFTGLPSNEPPPGTFIPPTRAGSILLTLLACPPYTLWAAPQLATRPPPVCPGTALPQPRYALLRSYEFRPEVYEGYEHRRTIGWKEGVSKGGNEEIVGRKGKARTWEFVRAEEGD